MIKQHPSKIPTQPSFHVKTQTTCSTQTFLPDLNQKLEIGLKRQKEVTDKIEPMENT